MNGVRRRVQDDPEHRGGDAEREGTLDQLAPTQAAIDPGLNQLVDGARLGDRTGSLSSYQVNHDILPEVCQRHHPIARDDHVARGLASLPRGAARGAPAATCRD